MEFFDIPESRIIKLNAKELEKLGYKAPLKVHFALAGGCVPSFRLVKKLKESDLSLGSSEITKEFEMKIPEKLNFYKKYCVAYDSEYVHIELERESITE